MDDANSRSLRDRLDELLRRAREISVEIERRVEAVTAEPGPASEQGESSSSAHGEAAPPEPTQEAMSIAAEAAAVTAEAAVVTAEALSAIATDAAAATPEAP